MEKHSKHKKLKIKKQDRLDFIRGRNLNSFEPKSHSSERATRSPSEEEKTLHFSRREISPFSAKKSPKTMLLGNSTLKSPNFSTPQKLSDRPRFDLWSRHSSTSEKLKRLNRSPTFLISRRGSSTTSSKCIDGRQSPNVPLSSRKSSISQEPTKLILTQRARPATTARTIEKIDPVPMQVQDSTIPNKMERTPSPTFRIPLKPMQGGSLRPTRPKSTIPKKVTLQQDETTPTHNPQTARLETISSPREHQETQNSSSLTNLHTPKRSKQEFISATPSIEVKRLPPTNRAPKSAGFKNRRRAVVFNGIWDQYEEIWFDIHSAGLTPFFDDIPMPEVKPPIIRTPLYQEVQTTPIRVQKPKNQLFRIRMWKPEDDLLADKCVLCVHKWGKVYFSCGHLFCKECVQTHLKKHFSQKLLLIMCPNPKCKYELSKQEIIKNTRTVELIKQYFELSVSRHATAHPNRFTVCFTMNCGYLFDLSRLRKKDVLNCPRCKQNYCLKCHKQVHPGFLCDEIH